MNMMDQSLADATPDEIVVSRDRLTLTLSTQGRRDVLDAGRLRLACRCAWCTRDRLTDVFPEHFADVAIARVAPIGGHALHISFSDGHSRGIFPFQFLRGIAGGEGTA